MLLDTHDIMVHLLSRVRDTSKFSNSEQPLDDTSSLLASSSCDATPLSYRTSTMTIRPSHALLLLLLASHTHAFPRSQAPSMPRPCIQPVRNHRSQVCTEPTVPESICQGLSCEHIWDTDVGSVVAQALLADFGVFDVVFLPANAFAGPLHQGTVSATEMEQILPWNDELVALRLNGTDLKEAVEHGVDQYHFHDNHDAYPRLAGIRFQVKLDQPYGERVQKVELMNVNCNWKALQPDKEYSILTTQHLADGGLDYRSLTRPRTRLSTQTGLRDAYWFHATSTCVIRNPYRKPKKAAAVRTVASLPTAQKQNGTITTKI